jgi:hypothetical protein
MAINNIRDSFLLKSGFTVPMLRGPHMGSRFLQTEAIIDKNPGIRQAIKRLRGVRAFG